MSVINFAKVKPDAKIPSKRTEDVAYDIYACFDDEVFVIKPFESRLVPTGIASSFSSDYGIAFRERGSTGVKNIKINAGVIDSGYRDEWFVSLYNANSKPLVITKKEEYDKDMEEFFIFYPYKKAIAQAIVINVLDTNIEEITYEELKQIPSERGMGSVGSSGK